MQASESKLRRNKIFWGAENPSLARKLFVALCLVVILVMSYAATNRGFFPSDAWKTISFFLSMTFSLSVTAGLYHAHRTGKIKLKNGKKPSLLAHIIMLVFFFPMVFWLTITDGFGCAYTEWFGVPAVKTITVSEKITGRGYKSYETTYCLRSQELRGDFISALCVQKNDHERLEIGSQVLTYGKESWFGFVFKKYVILKI
ncbi:MAG: hypothetical protein KJ017_09205 [Alphaproteobacteria bacterium]|nr:hypothetical protein [Alphaproteobacteria bacterium]